MKKIIAMLLVATMVCASLIGCSGTPTTQNPANADVGAGTDQKIVIKAADTQPLEHPMHLAFLKFKEIAESESSNIEVEVYGNSALGSDSEVTEGVQMGTIQIGTCGTSNLSEFTDAFLVYDLPYIFDSVENAEKVLDGEIGQSLLKELENEGIIGLAYTELGFRNVFNSIRPIESVADMKDLKLRCTSSPIHIATLEALGANPTPLSFGEVYTALQQGALDGVDQDLNLAWSNRFQEVQSYVTLTQSSYFPHVFMINKAFFESLSEENQQIICDAAKEMAAYERQLVRESEKNMIESMKTSGITVTELSDEQKAEFVAAVQPVYDQFADQIGEDLIKRVQDEINK